MKYIFQLGTNQALSVAEICAVFPDTQIIHLEKEILVIDCSEFDANLMIKRLGGTIKIAEYLDTSAENNIINSLINILPTKHEGKFNFGISSFAKKINSKALGMEIKNILKERGLSVRLVVSRERILSSVVVEQNKLTRGGLELILVGHDKKIIMGRTLAVQDFKGLSDRDYGRPARDDQSGMIPPKLAQILINLSGAKKNDTILDPFCGSGTMLMELALMNFQNIIGTDVSPKAIADSKRNIEWLEYKFKIQNSKFKIMEADAINISKILKPNSINSVITEPYLGPQRGALQMNKLIPELENLYSKAIAEFSKILKPKGRVVMIWPEFRGAHSTERITPNSSSPLARGRLGGGLSLNPSHPNFQIINPLPSSIQSQIKLSNRDTIIYGREGQRVFREIVILEKK